MDRQWLVVVVVASLILLSACESADLPWADDFSDPTGGWLVESDASAQVEYHDGVMRILIRLPNSIAWAAAQREFSDFRLSVDATQMAGPDDNEYGVLLRMQDPQHFYRFSISGDGYYQVAKFDGVEWLILSGDDWLHSEVIHPGSATNRLQVLCQGSTMAFSVNGVELVEVQDSSYSRGDVGLYAGAFFEPDVEVHFDNLRVEAP
jgi:hypothetical protein